VRRSMVEVAMTEANDIHSATRVTGGGLMIDDTMDGYSNTTRDEKETNLGWYCDSRHFVLGGGSPHSNQPINHDR